MEQQVATKAQETIELRTLFSATNKLADIYPDRPLGRYPGSKNKLSTWIVPFYPAHHGTYVEPFGGMAATLFRKVRSGIEVYNDINGDVVHLFKTIRECPEELINAIRYTPWSPIELQTTTEPTDDPIERARRFYTRLWMAHYPFDKTVHFRRQMVYSIKNPDTGSGAMVPAAKLFADIDYLWVIAERLRGVVIEGPADALGIIDQYDYDRALFYCDPPYPHETRARKKHYRYELDTSDHAKLAHKLNEIEGMAIVSGYACQQYKELYEDRGWIRHDKLARSNGENKTESIWINPKTAHYLIEEAQEIERDKNPQLHLFEDVL